jgi:transcriptional regulator with XRE-family HTH domain
MSKEAEPRARPRAARRVIDWHQAAELLAQGLTIAAVAKRVGCSRAVLSRRSKQDPVFQSGLARCRETQAGKDDTQLAELRQALEHAIENGVCSGSVRMTLWLADRLKLVTPPSQGTPQQELRAILSALTPAELREFEALRDEL